MIGYVTLGTNDLANAAKFYDALLATIGARRFMESDRFIAWAVSPTAMRPANAPATRAVRERKRGRDGINMVQRSSVNLQPTKLPRASIRQAKGRRKPGPEACRENCGKASGSLAFHLLRAWAGVR